MAVAIVGSILCGWYLRQDAVADNVRAVRIDLALAVLHALNLRSERPKEFMYLYAAN